MIHNFLSWVISHVIPFSFLFPCFTILCLHISIHFLLFLTYHLLLHTIMSFHFHMGGRCQVGWIMFSGPFKSKTLVLPTKASPDLGGSHYLNFKQAFSLWILANKMILESSNAYHCRFSAMYESWPFLAGKLGPY